jgi:hypothetical protein
MNDETLLSGLFAAELAPVIEQEKAAAKAADAAQREAERDLVGEKLCADEYSTEYNLTIDSSLGTWRHKEEYPYPFNLPSRLMQFPVNTERGPGPEDEDGNDLPGPRWISVAHPLLIDHPFVKGLIAKGYEVIPDPEDDRCRNQHGTKATHYTKSEYYHAVDLIKSHHKELIDTLRFTTTDAVFSALSYGCHYPKEKEPLSATIVRISEVLAAIQCEAKPVTPERMVQIFDTPHACTSESKKNPYYPINLRYITREELKENRAEEIWGYLWGMTSGWFQNDRGFLHWSAKGIAEYAKWGGKPELPDNTGATDEDEDEIDDRDPEEWEDVDHDPDCEECGETPCVCGCPDCGEQECTCPEPEPEAEALLDFPEDDGLAAGKAKDSTPTAMASQMSLF